MGEEMGKCRLLGSCFAVDNGSKARQPLDTGNIFIIPWSPSLSMREPLLMTFPLTTIAGERMYLVPSGAALFLQRLGAPS